MKSLRISCQLFLYHTKLLTEKRVNNRKDIHTFLKESIYINGLEEIAKRAENVTFCIQEEALRLSIFISYFDEIY